MADRTLIAWTDHTHNIAHGCFKISPGCQHCYALDATQRRTTLVIWGPPATTDRRTFGDEHWAKPFKWQRRAVREGRPHRVFCSSMCDNFEDHPTIVGELAKLWPLIRATPMLDWQLLTKRADRIAQSLPADWGTGYPNVWLGVSVENQKYADERIPLLLQVPALVHFVSYEPALGPVDFSPWLQLRLLPFGQRQRRLDWIIVGGESGPQFRAMDVQWARDVRDQCARTGVAYFFKQSAARYTEMGTTLDGQTIRQYPESR